MHSKPQPLRTRSHSHRDSEPDAHSGPRRPSRQATTPTQLVTIGERTTGRARPDRNRSARRNIRPNPDGVPPASTKPQQLKPERPDDSAPRRQYLRSIAVYLPRSTHQAVAQKAEAAGTTRTALILAG